MSTYPKKLTIDTCITNIIINSREYIVPNKETLDLILNDNVFNYPVLNRVYAIKNGTTEVVFQHCIKMVTLTNIKSITNESK